MATSIYRYIYIDIFPPAKSESLRTQDIILFIQRVHRYYIQLQFLLFLFHLKRPILDKVSLDFYIYQLFNIHTERLLDTVVTLNFLM